MDSTGLEDNQEAVEDTPCIVTVPSEDQSDNSGDVVVRRTRWRCGEVKLDPDFLIFTVHAGSLGLSIVVSLIMLMVDPSQQVFEKIFFLAIALFVKPPTLQAAAVN